MTGEKMPDFVDIDIIGRSDPSIRNDLFQVRMSTPAGGFGEGTLNLDELSTNATALFSLANSLGVPVLSRTRKNALLASLEAKISARLADNDLPLFLPAEKTGWIGKKCFVTPTDVFGESDLIVRRTFGKPPLCLNCARKGSLEDWKRGPGRMMNDAPELIFLAGAALMPALLPLMNISGCGFGLIGDTSKGKSSAMQFMGSIRGGGDEQGPRFNETWRATANGFDPFAPYFNHILFLLDDIQDLPGNDRQKAALLRELIYMLCAGREKARKGSNFPTTWTTVFFTAHNITLASVMKFGGEHHNQAAEVRFIELPWRGLRGPAFSDALRRRSLRSYGAPWHEFLRRLTEDLNADASDLEQWIQERIDSMQHKYLKIRDDESRVSQYFGLAYAAALLAVSYGILPVSEDDVRQSVIDAYAAHRRHVEETRHQADPLTNLRHYIERNIDAFVDSRKGRGQKSQGEAAGYITEGHKGKEFSFLSEQFRRGIKPFSSKITCDALKDAGLLNFEEGGERSNARNSTHRTISGEVQRVYSVDMRILDRG